MSADIDVTPGTGKTVATTEVSSRQYQNILVADPVTGLPQDLSGGKSLNDVYTALTTPATSIPHFGLDGTTDLSYVFSTGSASGERAAIVSATSAQTTKVYRMVITAAAATVIELRDGASGTALWSIEFPAAGAYTFDFDPRPWLKTTANTALIMNSTVATKVTLAVWYVKAA